MKTPRWLDQLFRSKILYGGAALMTIATSVFVVASSLITLPAPILTLIFALATLAAGTFMFTAIYSLRFRGEVHRLTDQVAFLSLENKNLKECATTLHRINHNYRDVLHDMFGKAGSPQAAKEAVEQRMLKAACEKIAEIFSLLIGTKCIVTVKLITKHSDGKDRCHTLARSELNSERDQSLVHYEINTGKNPAFDTARRYNPSGPSHFFSSDLVNDYQENKYTNERLDWQRFYRSAIVVPIRYVNYPAIGSEGALNELGFLAVDTMVTGKLNNSFHIQFLAAFADQMYNFMSLMRGRYSLLPHSVDERGTLVDPSNEPVKLEITDK